MQVTGGIIQLCTVAAADEIRSYWQNVEVDTATNSLLSAISTSLCIKCNSASHSLAHWLQQRPTIERFQTGVVSR